eukprot:TRINITY_DN3059_c0_g1_i3.p1 TRINITY_DN3059_c0_g1~~TRINITY_DN3059_c0_g1_i3.p1  ORF type:complete len:600 (+),score=127.19 TRINITY_DN3059_c0_g1_i3:36-1835(+)
MEAGFFCRHKRCWSSEESLPTHDQRNFHETLDHSIFCDDDCPYCLNHILGPPPPSSQQVFASNTTTTITAPLKLSLPEQSPKRTSNHTKASAKDFFLDFCNDGANNTSLKRSIEESPYLTPPDKKMALDTPSSTSLYTPITPDSPISSPFPSVNAPILPRTTPTYLISPSSTQDLKDEETDTNSPSPLHGSPFSHDTSCSPIVQRMPQLRLPVRRRIPSRISPSRIISEEEEDRLISLDKEPASPQRRLPPGSIDASIPLNFELLQQYLDIPREQQSLFCWGVFFDHRTNFHSSALMEHLGEENSMMGISILPSLSKKPFALVLNKKGPDHDAVDMKDRWELVMRFLQTDSPKVCYDTQQALEIIFSSLNTPETLTKLCDVKHLLDPKIASWLLDTNLQESSLDFDSLVEKHLLFTPQIAKSLSIIDSFTKEMILCIRLMSKLETDLDQQNLASRFLNIEMKIIPVLAYMGVVGIRFDVEKLRTYSTELRQTQKRLQEESEGHLGGSINLSSQKQVAEVLFNKLGLVVSSSKPSKSSRDSGSSPATSAIILNKLKDQHPFVNLLIGMLPHLFPVLILFVDMRRILLFTLTGVVSHRPDE